jgi:hypothetical protein
MVGLEVQERKKECPLVIPVDRISRSGIAIGADAPRDVGRKSFQTGLAFPDSDSSNDAVDFIRGPSIGKQKDEAKQALTYQVLIPNIYDRMQGTIAMGRLCQTISSTPADLRCCCPLGSFMTPMHFESI